MMYNPQLDTFICVVEAGSFSKAADKLYISPPAVIKQINSLENNLGVQLFARTHRGLVVTAAGESLYQDAKYMVNYSKEAIERAKEAGNDEDDVIRVGISPMTPPQVFVELWPRIQEQYPEVKFKLVPFENTPENAREILANLGQNIDVIAGIFDEAMLELRKCNGVELSSGAVRNHDPEIMVKAFELVRLGEEDVKKKFPAMSNAFCYGAPPHAGIAPGVDRMVMLLAGESSIREIIPFPMNKNAQDIMMGAPSTVEQKQLDELHIAITAQEEE